MKNGEWREDEVDVLLESTTVSERSQWDQRDLNYKYPSKYPITLFKAWKKFDKIANT